MAARAIGSATISFGLIAIPVKLYTSAVTSSAIRFNQLHKDCGTRLKQQLVCPKDDVVVERDDVVKGYEFAKGQYVMFSPEELKALEEKSTQSIEIAEFVPAEKVERLYLDKVYYLGPDKGGARPYRLLSAALEQTGRAALGQYAARGKQYLVMIRPYDNGLLMEQLRYQDEVRGFDEIPIDEADVKDPELQLAIQLIEQSSNDDFQPDGYEDQVRARMLEAIEQKIAGEEISIAEDEESETRVIDMMEALKASLAAKGVDTEERKPAKKASSKKKTAKKKAG
ncbi:MAG: Ku protein [Pseudomonadota bacterium]